MQINGVNIPSAATDLAEPLGNNRLSGLILSPDVNAQNPDDMDTSNQNPIN
jgi:hypothetical protein